MRKSIKIGTKEYKFKKDAINHYKLILNSYNFGQSLNESDFTDLLNLLEYNYFNYLTEGKKSETENEVILDRVEIDDISAAELVIEDIKVAKVQFNTKYFEVFYNDNTSEYISYLLLFNVVRYNSENMFRIACRNAILTDIRCVKQIYFDNNSVKGQVRCQETGILSKWSELVVDHRQPNTFSMILERFKELNDIDLEVVEFVSNDQNHIVFQNDSISEQFRCYHKSKASLRIIRKECNANRASMARIKKTTKDLTIL